MTRRMIDSSMWSNENFAALPAMARLLQIGIINHADDQGRIKANPLYLSKEIFPYDRVTPANATKWLEQIAANGTILLYTVEGKQYAQLTKWWQYQSLQYAAPSDYPTPPSWKDRIRRTATKGFIATYNWTLTNGVTVEDTCDERGKLLPPKSTVNEKLPTTSKPPANGDGHSPDAIPLDSPESTPERTNKLNLIELNLTEEEEGERARASPARITSLRERSSKVEQHQSPHLNPNHFVNGYIPPGTGINPLEIYYERFSINQDVARLNAIKEDDLVHLCPDLNRLREVVTAYSRTTFQPGNLQLILDWYREGIPNKRNPAEVSALGSGNYKPSGKKPPAIDQLFDYARRQVADL